MIRRHYHHAAMLKSGFGAKAIETNDDRMLKTLLPGLQAA
jgi:hypothetical protein